MTALARESARSDRASTFARWQTLAAVMLFCSLPYSAIGQIVPTAIGAAAVFLSIALCLAAGILQLLALKARAGRRSHQHLQETGFTSPGAQWLLLIALIGALGHAALFLLRLVT